MSTRIALSLAVLLAVAGFSHAAVATIPMIVDNSQTTPQGWGGSPAGTLSDPFAYDPSDPTSVSPVQVYSGGLGFHSNNNTSTHSIGYQFSGGAQKQISLDIWGRSAAAEVSRHQNLTVELFNGNWTTPVHTTTGFNGVSGAPDYYGRFVAPADVQADRAKITKPAGDYFVFMEARGVTAAGPVPVALQTPTATFVRGAPFAPANSIDHVVANGNNGWAMNGGAETQSPQAFVIQTAAPLTSASGLLQFELPQRYGSNHVINDFRISATTEPNPTTATASWTELTPAYTHAAGGLTPTADNHVTRNAVTATGRNWYTVTAHAGSLKDITGFRVEMFPNPKVGAASNGNAVLTEFQVYDAPHEINVALDKPTTGDAAGYPTANGVDFNIGNFTHANNTNPPPNNPYWQVDLEGSYDLSRVEIVARGDCCGDRLNGSVLTVMDSAMTPIYTSAPVAGSTNGASFTFDAGGAGFDDAAHIRVDGNQQYFQFAELRAWHVPTDIPVPLQEATADKSQAGYSVDNILLNNTAGWAAVKAGDSVATPQTAALETMADIGFDGGSTLTLRLDNNSSYAQHAVGKFRISVTTADRGQFADGLDNGGDLGDPSIWTELTPLSVSSSGGASVNIGADNTVLLGGANPASDTYTFVANTTWTGITGIRLETLADPSLPHAGPGRYGSNGNYVMTGFSGTVSALGTQPVNIAQAAGVNVVGGSDAVNTPQAINDGVTANAAGNSAFINPPRGPQGLGYDLGGWATVDTVRIYQHALAGDGGTRRRLDGVIVYTSQGPITITGLPDQDVIDLDLGGVNTSYVFVRPISQHAGAPDPRLGIREIEVLTTGLGIAPRLNAALGAGVTLTGAGWNANAGSPGLITDGVTTWGPDLGNYSTGVFNNNIAAANAIELDLGQAYLMDTLGIVQQTYGGGGARRMIEDILLEFSNDSGFAVLEGSRPVTLLDGAAYQQVAFDAIRSQFVRLSPLTQYGTGNDANIGIIEVQLFAVPEPATMVLAGLAISALGGYVRRRRRNV